MTRRTLLSRRVPGAGALAPRLTGAAECRFMTGVCEWTRGKSDPSSVDLDERISLEGGQITLGTVANGLNLWQPAIQQRVGSTNNADARSVVAPSLTAASFSQAWIFCASRPTNATGSFSRIRGAKSHRRQARRTQRTLLGDPFDDARLSVWRTPTNTGVVLWPLPAEGWLLHASVNLVATGTNTWTLIPPPYAANATGCLVTGSAPMRNRFDRLRKP